MNNQIDQVGNACKFSDSQICYKKHNPSKRGIFQVQKIP